MIEDAPLLTLRSEFPRPDATLVAALKDAPTSQIVDALGGRGALDYRIKPMTGSDPLKTRLAGVAVTCHTGPSDNLALFGALVPARAGDVLVCATEFFEGSSVTGDLLIGMARNRGVAGLVTDGLVRDVPAMLSVGLPIFCTGVSANSPARNGPGTVGFPVTIGGVLVELGDVIVGDCDGVVVVPQAKLAETVRKLAAVRAAEADFERRVHDGLQLPDFLVELMELNRVSRV